MEIHLNITSVAALIGDPTRAAILLALADLRALPAGELAKIAKVSPQTASSHLAKLMAGGLISVETWGRYRYYRLASPEVAKVLESLAGIASPAPVSSLRQSEQLKTLKFARTCYDHIAGKLGVSITQAFIDQNFIIENSDGYLLTDQGEAWLNNFGVNINAKKNHRVIPWHIDWTQRVHHMAGPIAVGLTNRLFELNLITRGSVHRSVKLTEHGYDFFENSFRISLPKDKL
ncbi:ArsR/SmtB family transcription factor [Pectinatus frisingensis]|uniref:ArsR/SmtB family transcription factor n=1 Tax=Pectinatus frisingensis TaxID=865 RepID=UPI0018C6BE82|nr:helix-turn-helix domain-containing protein [Pectinatus frisingensis]